VQYLNSTGNTVIIRFITGFIVLLSIALSAHSLANDITKPGRPQVTLLEELPEQKIPAQALNATYEELDDFVVKKNLKEGTHTTRRGNWDGVLGSTQPNSGVDEWYRVTIPPYGSTASTSKLLLDPSIKEAWASYSMQVGNNWTPTDGVKLPGFSSHINNAWTGDAGGNGGGWGGLCRSWSARSLLAPAHKDEGLMRMYVYHAESDNHAGDAKPTDHPCLNNSNNPIQSNKRTYGETINPSSGYITDHNWHTITHHVKLNDIDAFNGSVELYIDEVLVSQATGLNFTNNPEYHNIAFWFTVFHGGQEDTSGTNHDLFFHSFRWNAGAENFTWEN